MTTFLSYEPASFHPKPTRRDGAQSLPAVRVANGAGERVGGVRRGRTREPEQPLHHFLHLFLFRVAVADHGLLHLERRVLCDRQSRIDRGADRRAARLAERERGGGIDVDEDFLQRDLLRAVLADDFSQASRMALRRSGRSAPPDLTQPLAM